MFFRQPISTPSEPPQRFFIPPLSFDRWKPPAYCKPLPLLDWACVRSAGVIVSNSEVEIGRTGIKIGSLSHRTVLVGVRRGLSLISPEGLRGKAARTVWERYACKVDFFPPPLLKTRSEPSHLFQTEEPTSAAMKKSSYPGKRAGWHTSKRA